MLDNRQNPLPRYNVPGVTNEEKKKDAVLGSLDKTHPMSPHVECFNYLREHLGVTCIHTCRPLRDTKPMGDRIADNN